MRILTCVIATMALSGAFAADPPSDVSVALTVLQPGSLGRMTVSQLAKTSLPKKGESLQVRIAVATACHAIIVAFDGSGQIGYPDQPVAAALQPGDQKQIPSGGQWKWETPDAVSELEVLIVDDRAPALPGLSQLIEAMHTQAVPAVRARQVGELRRMMDSLTQRNTASAEYSLKTDPVALGGVLRGDVCDWCKDAWKISLPASGSWMVRQRFSRETPR